jgi:Skp family chaperone for outer membrane proteins
MSMSPIQVLALSFGLSTALSPAALAQAASAPAPAAATASPGPVATKIGVVHIQDAIMQTEEGKKEFDALQQRFSPKQAELKGLNDEVEKLKQQYQAQSDKLSEDERNTRAKTIDTKQKALQRNFEDAQAEFQQAEQELVNRLGGKMLKVLEKYAQTNSFSIVLDVSNPQTSPVLWATQGTVITKELVDAYNAENPVAGASGAKPAGAAAPATRPAAPVTRPAAATPSPTPKKP